jgi:hypothetical protein
MSTLRAGQPGATRVCPHCKATVLESASICPGCRHHLRFSGGKQLAEESYTALSVDGTIAHRESAQLCEYCVVLDITNERGEQVMRQVVGVGALQPGERRRLNVSVQMLPLVPAQLQPQVQPQQPPRSPPSAPAPAGALRPAGTAATAGPTGSAPAGAPRTPRPSTPPATPAANPRPGTPRIAPLTPGATGAGAAPAAGGKPAAGTPAPAAPAAAPSGAAQRLHIFRKP